MMESMHADACLKVVRIVTVVAKCYIAITCI